MITTLLRETLADESTSKREQQNMRYEYARLLPKFNALAADAIASDLFPPDTTGALLMGQFLTASASGAIDGL